MPLYVLLEIKPYRRMLNLETFPLFTEVLNFYNWISDRKFFQISGTH